MYYIKSIYYSLVQKIERVQITFFLGEGLVVERNYKTPLI